MAKLLEQSRCEEDVPEDAMVPLTPLLKILECCVCLDTVKVPFKQCNRGHLVCSECMRRLSTCPTCRGDTFLDNPIAVKSLLEALPRPCRYSGAGCKEILPMESNHSTYCGYRPVKCKALACSMNLTVSQLKKHVGRVHYNYSRIVGMKDRLEFYLNLVDSFEYGLPINVMDPFFWLHIKNTPDTGLLRASFEAVFEGVPDSDYYINLSFPKASNSDIHLDFSLKASMFNNNDILDEDATVELPLSLLEKYADPNTHGYVKIGCSIIPKPISKT